MLFPSIFLTLLAVVPLVASTTHKLSSLTSRSALHRKLTLRTDNPNKSTQNPLPQPNPKTSQKETPSLKRLYPIYESRIPILIDSLLRKDAEVQSAEQLEQTHLQTQSSQIRKMPTSVKDERLNSYFSMATKWSLMRDKSRSIRDERMKMMHELFTIMDLDAHMKGFVTKALESRTPGVTKRLSLVYAKEKRDREGDHGITEQEVNERMKQVMEFHVSGRVEDYTAGQKGKSGARRGQRKGRGRKG